MKLFSVLTKNSSNMPGLESCSRWSLHSFASSVPRLCLGRVDTPQSGSPQVFYSAETKAQPTVCSLYRHILFTQCVYCLSALTRRWRGISSAVPSTTAPGPDTRPWPSVLAKWTSTICHEAQGLPQAPTPRLPNKGSHYVTSCRSRRLCLC